MNALCNKKTGEIDPESFAGYYKYKDAYVNDELIKVWKKKEWKESEVTILTTDKLKELLIRERKRARDIAYQFMTEHDEAFKSKKKAGNKLAFIEDRISDECRLIGNAISGGNALSVTLGETMEERVIKDNAALLTDLNPKK